MCVNLKSHLAAREHFHIVREESQSNWKQVFPLNSGIHLFSNYHLETHSPVLGGRNTEAS